MRKLTKVQNDSYWAGWENGAFVARQVNAGMDPALLDGFVMEAPFPNPHRTPEGIRAFNEGMDDAILMDCGKEINVKFF